MQHELGAGRASVACHRHPVRKERWPRSGRCIRPRGMEGINLPAALPSALGADLAGARERGCEGGMKLGLVRDFAPDIVNEPPQPCAQEPHFSIVAIKLMEWP